MNHPKSIHREHIYYVDLHIDYYIVEDYYVALSSVYLIHSLEPPTIVNYSLILLSCRSKQCMVSLLLLFINY